MPWSWQLLLVNSGVYFSATAQLQQQLQHHMGFFKSAVLALQNEKLIVDEFLDKVAAASRGVSHMLYECIKHLPVALT